MENQRRENDLTLSAVTTQDIDKIRSSIEVGDKICFNTCRVRDRYSSKSPSQEQTRSGVVISKTKFFAVVQYQSGMHDTVLWTDLIDRQRKKETIVIPTPEKKETRGRKKIAFDHAKLKRLLIDELEKKNMSRRAFAIRNGIEPESLGQWVRGVASPTQDNLAKLSKALNVPAEVFALEGGTEA